MSGLGTKHLIAQQVPSHIRESSPLFVKFLQYYYEFNEQLNIQKAIQDILTYNNCDAAEIEFVKSFFEELQILPKTIAADTRLVAKHIYDLYRTKGSEQSVKLLFKIVFGETVGITYPSEQILRASDGKWVREHTLTLSKIYGNVNDSTNRISFTGTRGSFTYEINQIVNIDTNIVRVVFCPNLPYFMDGVTNISLYSNDDLDFVGTIIPTVSEISIEDGGRYWQTGQVIILPGIIDTIIRITRIRSGGTILSAEIVQSGYGHADGEIYTLSPFKYRPSGEYVEQYSNNLSTGGVAHTVNIFEYMNGIGENILMLDSDQTYILAGYVDVDYINKVSISNTISIDSASASSNISIDQWVESRTRIRVIKNSIAIKPGYYKNQDGMISVSEIRLQDNFYYQIFSYVIETAQRLKDFYTPLSKIHPAGFKYFGNLTKTLEVDMNIEVNRILSRESVLVIDYINPGDEIPAINIDHRLYTPMIVDDINLSNSYDLNNDFYLYGTDNDYDEIINGTDYYSREDNVEKIINYSVADTFTMIEFENSGSYDYNNYPAIYGLTDDYDIADGTDDQYSQEGAAFVASLNS